MNPRVPVRLLVLLAGVLCAGGCGRPDATSDSPSGAASLRLLDLSDHWVQPFPVADAKALVFLFVSTDCPISNRYAPQIKRLHEHFAARGVRFQLVYPNASTSAAAAHRHLQEYGYSFGALRDPQHVLVKRAGATVTPEAAVFSPEGRLLYRGRIDDRFPKLGTERAAATQADLENALNAILDGRLVTPRFTQPVGCYIAD